MEIITSIPSLAFAGNFPDIEISSDIDVDFQLAVGDHVYKKFVTLTTSANLLGFSVGEVVTGETSAAEGRIFAMSGSGPYNIVVGQYTDEDFQEENVSDDARTIYVYAVSEYTSDQYDPTILNERYTPDTDDTVIIELREFLERMLEVNIPPTDQTLYEQTTGYRQFTLKVGALDPVSFYVIKGGIQSLPDPDSVWLGSNFLTWQERIKKVKTNDPEFLSFFPQEGCIVKARAYFSDNTTATENIQTLLANKLYSFNCTWSVLRARFDDEPYQIDVWVEKTDGSAAISYVQRYVLFSEHFDNDDIFVFANSLGGVDTIRFTGVKEEVEQFNLQTAFYEREEREYNVNAERVYDKNTGDFRSRHHLFWARDFFASKYKYHWQYGLFFRVITEGRELTSRLYNLNSYAFRFRESEQTLYQNYFRMNPDEVELGSEILYVKVPEGDYILTPDGQKLEYY